MLKRSLSVFCSGEDDDVEEGEVDKHGKLQFPLQAKPTHSKWMKRRTVKNHLEISIS